MAAGAGAVDGSGGAGAAGAAGAVDPAGDVRDVGRTDEERQPRPASAPGGPGPAGAVGGPPAHGTGRAETAERAERAERAARARATLIAVLALAAIGFAVGGFPLPAAAPPPAESPLPGVRARGAPDTFVRSGQSLPAGELAFLAVEPASGVLVATDQRRGTLARFDAGGRLLGEWGPRIAGLEPPLAEPAGVAFDSRTGGYVVVDRASVAPRLIRLDAEGRAGPVVDLQPFGPYGLNGLALDQKGAAYVADTGRNRILVFSSGGQLLKEVGRPGKDLGQFTQPMALAFTADGSAFFVTDWENARIQRWERDFTATHAWATGYRSFGVAVDPLGRVYAVDAERRRVQAFTPRTGDVLGEIGGQGKPPLDLAGPKQLAFAPNGSTLYVLGQNGIARVELENTEPPPQRTGDGFRLGFEVDVTSLLALAAVGLVGALVLRRNRRLASRRATTRQL